MSKDAPKGITRLGKALALLKTVCVTMPMQQIEMLQKIAENPGITMTEFENLVGKTTSQGAISRNAKELGKYAVKDPATGNLKLIGHDLIETRPDPYHRRRLGMWLTPKGKKLMQELAGCWEMENR